MPKRRTSGKTAKKGGKGTAHLLGSLLAKTREGRKLRRDGEKGRVTRPKSSIYPKERGPLLHRLLLRSGYWWRSGALHRGLGTSSVTAAALLGNLPPLHERNRAIWGATVSGLATLGGTSYLLGVRKWGRWVTSPRDLPNLPKQYHLMTPDQLRIAERYLVRTYAIDPSFARSLLTGGDEIKIAKLFFNIRTKRKGIRNWESYKLKEHENEAYVHIATPLLSYYVGRLPAAKVNAHTPENASEEKKKFLEEHVGPNIPLYKPQHSSTETKYGTLPRKDGKFIEEYIPTSLLDVTPESLQDAVALATFAASVATAKERRFKNHHRK